MDSKTGLTLEDVAILADGRGNIPDETAARLQPLIREDERFAEALAALRQMAADAGTELLADGLGAFEGLSRLRTELWQRPSDVLHPDLEVPFRELIAMAGAMAERAEGEEQAELRQLRRRLIAAFGDDLGRQRIFQALLDQLLAVEEEVVRAVVRHLVRLYRRRRKAAGPPRRPSPGVS